MPQLDYLDQSATPAMEGGLYDTGPSDVVTRANGGTNAAQAATITVTGSTTAAVAEQQTFTWTTDNTAQTVTVAVDEFIFSLVSTGVANTDTASLSALMNADAGFTARFTAVPTTNTILITSKRPGTPFAAGVQAQGTCVVSFAITTVNVIGTQFQININGVQIQYAAASTNATNEIAALLAILQANVQLQQYVTFSAAAAVLSILAITPGQPFTITYANANFAGDAGAGTVALAITTPVSGAANVYFGRALISTTVDGQATLPAGQSGFKLEGISVNRAHYKPQNNAVYPPASGAAFYGAGEPIPVIRFGRIWVLVEDGVATVQAAVRIRVTQSASDLNGNPGRFRSTADAGKTVLATSGMRWVTSKPAVSANQYPFPAAFGSVGGAGPAVPYYLAALEFDAVTCTFTND